MEKRTLGLEARGRSHIENGLPCQDKVHAVVNGDVACVALADGAGSARLSHVGADLVAKAVASLLCEEFNNFINSDGKQFVLAVCDVISTTLNEYVESSGCQIKDLSSTLLVVAANDEFFVVLHLGDGVVAGVKNGHAYTISNPDNGEFTNSTYFTTSSNFESKVRVYKGKVASHSGFALMSDGTAESFYLKKTGQVAQGVKRIVEGVATLDLNLIRTKLEKSFNDIITKKTLDDCSIAVLSFHKNVNEYDYKKQCELLGLRYGHYRSKRLVESYNQVIWFAQNNKIHHIRRYYNSKAVRAFCKQEGLSKRGLKRRLLKLEARGVISSSQQGYS